MDYSLYVGTNSVRGSQGIYHIKLDGETGKITCTDIIPFYNSGYLVRNRAGDRLYVLTESMTFRGKASGGVVAYDISGDSPKEINSRFTCGQRPCHCALSQDERTLFAGNFFGGTIAVFPIDEDGGLCPASHIFAHE